MRATIFPDSEHVSIILLIRKVSDMATTIMSTEILEQNSLMVIQPCGNTTKLCISCREVRCPDVGAWQVLTSETRLSMNMPTISWKR